MQARDANWEALDFQITSCSLCPRLVNFRQQIGVTKQPRYRDQTYWSKPLTGTGDRNARVLIIGLAPAAHGGNRTGRIFTGGSSASFLMRALYEAGYVNLPESNSCDDGLEFHDVYLTNLVHCAPPSNQPTAQEALNCRRHLLAELSLLSSLRAVVPLGSFALKGYLALLKAQGEIVAQSPFPFRHGVVYKTHPAGPLLIPSYHPSQQNTFTGKLTPEMLRELFLHVRSLTRP